MPKQLRDLEYANRPLLGNYTVIEASMISEVADALNDWPDKEKCVLIGGLAVSFYCKPRATQDVDFLYLVKPSIDSDLFKAIRPHAYRHKGTHVEIETLTPEFLSIPDRIAKRVFETARTDANGFMVASPEALIVLKSFRWSRQDQADVENLFFCVNGNLSSWAIPDESYLRIRSIWTDCKSTKTWNF